MAEDRVEGRRWSDPSVIVGGGAVVASLALAFADASDALAGLFFAGGVVLMLVHAFGRRLVKGKLELGAAGKFEFELAKEEEARQVTTAIAAAPQQPPVEVGLHEEDDLTRWLLADTLLRKLLVAPSPPVEDCRFQLFLYDPDQALLLPILDPGHPGPSPGFAPHQGTVGEAWATGEYVVATGPAVSDGTFSLSDEQKARYGDVVAAAAVPVTNRAGRIIGVVAGFSRDEGTALATAEGLDAQIFLAEATARVLIDLLKWFSDGYDGEGGRETPWSVR